MLVAPQGDFTVTDTYDTNHVRLEIGLAAGDQPLRRSRPRSPRPDAAATPPSSPTNAARGVILDDGASINFTQQRRQQGIPLP